MGGTTGGMQRDTAGKFQLLAHLFIVIVALLGSSMLAGGRLINRGAWTVAAAAVPERGVSADSYLLSSGVGFHSGPRASISGPQSVKDGSSATFSITVTGGSVASYEWS